MNLSLGPEPNPEPEPGPEPEPEPEPDPVVATRSELLAIKHIMNQTESELGMAALDGKVQSALDIHFFVRPDVEDDMIQVDEADRVQRHEAFFMSQVTAYNTHTHARTHPRTHVRAREIQLT